MFGVKSFNEHNLNNNSLVDPSIKSEIMNKTLKHTLPGCSYNGLRSENNEGIPCKGTTMSDSYLNKPWI